MKAGYSGAGKLCYRHMGPTSTLQQLNRLLPHSCAGAGVLRENASATLSPASSH